MNNGVIANSAINPTNGSTYQRSAPGVSSMLAGSATKSASTVAYRLKILGLSSMPTASASILGAEPNGLKYGAYVNTFELRRMIWNAPDLETRLKLQRVREKLEESQRRLSTGSSEAPNSTSEKFSFRSNLETSGSRADRKTRAARRTARSQPLQRNSSFTTHASATR